MKFTSQMANDLLRTAFENPGRVELRGRRLFAVRKSLSLTDRIANRTNCKGNWADLMTAAPNSREIRNYKPR